MPFELTDRHFQDFHTLGFCIFEHIIPLSLLSDLRREAEKGKEIARQTKGHQVQRLQPIKNYDLDMKPFTDFATMPDLVDALKSVLTPAHWYGRAEDDPLASTGILFEPAERPSCTSWHRDWRDNSRGLDVHHWQRVSQDIGLFNQVNCALYEDMDLWVIPGSHLRPDLPGEIRRFPTRPIPGPDLEGVTMLEEIERTNLEYCHSMPGAFQTHLAAGDFMLYRNSLWHLGNYTPWRKRATIHDFIGSPAFAEWMASPPKHPEPDENGWVNPNADTAEYVEVMRDM